MNRNDGVKNSAWSDRLVYKWKSFSKLKSSWLVRYMINWGPGGGMFCKECWDIEFVFFVFSFVSYFCSSGYRLKWRTIDWNGQSCESWYCCCTTISECSVL